jgi:hypothetical protein
VGWEEKGRFVCCEILCTYTSRCRSEDIVTTVSEKGQRIIPRAVKRHPTLIARTFTTHIQTYISEKSVVTWIQIADS